MARIALFFGFRSPLPALVAMECRRLAPAGLFHKQRQTASALVIGEDVIAQVDPRSARSTLATVLDRVLICAPGSDPGTVMPWRSAGMANIVSYPALRAAVERLAGPSRRPIIERAAWLPAAALGAPRMSRVAEAVETLEHLSIEAWAAALGVSVRSLERLVASTCSVPPRRLLDRYELAVCHSMIRSGATLADVAAALSRADAVSVAHFRSRMRNRLVRSPRDGASRQSR